MNRLIAVAPADLYKVWPRLREAALTIESPEDLIPEDVYTACKTNGATLFLLESEGREVGFMVARLNLPDLHIWWLHAETGYDVMTSFREQLMELARGAQARNLTYGSQRKAWQKVSAQHGFKMRFVVYECPVEGPKLAPPPAANDDGADNDQHATH